MDTNPRRTVIGLTIFAVTGALMIAVPAAVEQHADQVAIGAGIGTAFVAVLFTYGVLNRGSRAGSGRRAWVSGIGFLGAGIGIALSQVGVGGNVVLGLLGGMLLSYAVGVVVLPLVIHPAR